MKSNSKTVYVVKVVFMILFFCTLLFLFASNFNRMNRSALTYTKSIKDKKQPLMKTIFDFPKQFEETFSKEFLQRNQFMRIYDNNYLTLFGESSSQNFYIHSPKKTNIAFLSKHPDGHTEKLRYNLFFTLLNGGYGETTRNVEAARDSLLDCINFLENYDVPTVILSFPTKPFLQFDELPEIIQSTLGKEVYENPVQERIYKALPKAFREKHILNLFPLAIEENKKTALFPQQSFHWEERSYYTNLVASQIAQKFNISDSAALPLSQYKNENLKSDIAHLTNITLQKTKFLLFPSKSFDTLGVTSTKVTNHKNPNRKGKIVVIGDSFAKRLGKDLARYFGEVKTYGNGEFNQKNVEFIYKTYKPDYVVFISHKGLITISSTIKKYEKFYKEAQSHQKGSHNRGYSKKNQK